MRCRLGNIGSEERHTFCGVFERYGLKSGYREMYAPTLLLRDVRRITGRKMTDHLWFSLTKGFLRLGQLVQGDVVKFDGRVDTYIKGYDFKELDYRLTRPTKVSLLSADSRPSMPSTSEAIVGFIMAQNRMNEGIPLHENSYIRAYREWAESA